MNETSNQKQPDEVVVATHYYARVTHRTTLNSEEVLVTFVEVRGSDNNPQDFLEYNLEKVLGKKWLLDENETRNNVVQKWYYSESSKEEFLDAHRNNKRIAIFNRDLVLAPLPHWR